MPARYKKGHDGGQAYIAAQLTQQPEKAKEFTEAELEILRAVAEAYLGWRAFTKMWGFLKATILLIGSVVGSLYLFKEDALTWLATLIKSRL